MCVYAYAHTRDRYTHMMIQIIHFSPKEFKNYFYSIVYSEWVFVGYI